MILMILMTWMIGVTLLNWTDGVEGMKIPAVVEVVKVRLFVLGIGAFIRQVALLGIVIPVSGIADPSFLHFLGSISPQVIFRFLLNISFAFGG